MAKPNVVGILFETMPITYPFHYLSDDDFECLVNDICQKILGTGTVRFSKGPDGGRDGRFDGTAEKLPSSQNPWSGKFIIQAKHTANPIASCSDSSFANTELNNETLRLQNLVKTEGVDNYLLFTNRKLPANQDVRLRQKITTNTHIQNVIIFGCEEISGKISLERVILDKYRLLMLKEPLRFFDKDLKSIIVTFKNDVTSLRSSAEIVQDLKNIDKDKKNELNKLSKEYFQHIQENSLSYFTQIETFLSDPSNTSVRDKYDATINELQSKVIEKRGDFAAFEEIINYLFDHLITIHEELQEPTARKLVYVFLHYMYFHCDLGVKE